MKNLDITTPIKVYDYTELTGLRKELVDTARRATERAYAPYSNFHVGAAIALDNGEIIAGANQENAAFPSGTCAERSACFYAGATYPGVPFRAIAVAAVGTDGTVPDVPAAPCGACRQSLLEYEKLSGGPVEVLLAGKNEIYVFPSVKSLLPLSFSEL